MPVSATRGPHRGQRAHHARQARRCPEVPRHHRKQPARWNPSGVRERGDKVKNEKKRKGEMIPSATNGRPFILAGGCQPRSKRPDRGWRLTGIPRRHSATQRRMVERLLEKSVLLTHTCNDCLGLSEDGVQRASMCHRVIVR